MNPVGQDGWEVPKQVSTLALYTPELYSVEKCRMVSSAGTQSARDDICAAGELSGWEKIRSHIDSAIVAVGPRRLRRHLRRRRT